MTLAKVLPDVKSVGGTPWGYKNTPVPKLRNGGIVRSSDWT